MNLFITFIKIEQLERIEIEDSKKSEVIYKASLIIIFWMVINLMFIISIIIFRLDLMTIIFLIIFLLMLNLCFVSNIHTFLYNIPIHRAKFVISNDSIEIYLQNHMYKRIFWKDIEKIELVKERYDGGLYNPYAGGFKLKFYGFNVPKSLRLYCLIVHQEEMDLILSSLAYFSKIMNKEFIEIQELEKSDFEDPAKEITEVNNFRKKTQKKFN